MGGLAQAGYEVERNAVSPVGLVLQKYGSLRDLKALQDGWCYVEDEAAQLVPLLLDVQPDHRVLDVCAAPGGKTTHLAELMQNRGTLVALDRNPSRLNSVVSNCARLGITNVHYLVADVLKDLPLFSSTSSSLRASVNSHSTLFYQGFDRVLVDAPCSGMGILRRHPEGKWAKGPDLIRQAQKQQLQILDRVCDLLRPGGVLVYSACSIEPEETHQVLTSFCKRHQEFEHESVKPWLPAGGRGICDEQGNLFTPFSSYNMDGFFAVRLKKIGTP
jgi:16S rRNA (cytosine967-C5)-methyltransferase